MYCRSRHAATDQPICPISLPRARLTVCEEEEMLDEQMSGDEDSSCSQSPLAVKRLSSMDASSPESGVPPELRLMPHTDGPPRVCSRVNIASHRKFGPYQTKIRKDPSPTSFNWKVSPISFYFFFCDSVSCCLNSGSE